MAYVLDLNQSHQYTLELQMTDEAQTVFRVGLPTEAMKQELETMLPELTPRMAKGDKEAVEVIYDLAARLISRNRNFMVVSGDDLRDKYNMDAESALVFFNAYLGFLASVASEKN